MERGQSLRLYHSKTRSIEINIDIFIGKDTGDLVFEGQDLGEMVAGMYGDSDYEYWLVVKQENIGTIFESLKQMTPSARFNTLKRNATRNTLLLRLIREHFGHNQAVSSFQEWCQIHNIPCQFSNF